MLVASGVDDVGVDLGVLVIVGVSVMVGACAVIWAMTVWATEVEISPILNVGTGVIVGAALPQALKIKAPKARNTTILKEVLFIISSLIKKGPGIRIVHTLGIWHVKALFGACNEMLLRSGDNYHTKMNITLPGKTPVGILIIRSETTINNMIHRIKGGKREPSTFDYTKETKFFFSDYATGERYAANTQLSESR